MDPLEQVVAQKRVVRCPVREATLERCDIEDSLPRVDALSEQVLVHVGHGVRVEVEPRVRFHDSREDRRVSPAGGRLEPGLEDRVAGACPSVSVVPGPVQGVGQRRDQPHRGARGQVSVGIERDHVADSDELPEVTFHRPQARVVCAEKQAVELMQLASLALPAHPAPLGRVPLPGPVQQEKRDLPIPPVDGVQSGHALRRPLEDRLVRRRELGGSVGPVGEQSPPHVRVAVSLISHLEARQQGVHLLLVAHQDGNRDDRTSVSRDPVRQVELRQHPRRDQGGGQPIRDAERDGRGGNDSAQQHQRDHGAGRTGTDRRTGQREEQQEGESETAATVGEADVPQEEATRARSAGRPVAEDLFEGGAALADQPVADVPFHQVTRGLRGPGSPHGLVRDRILRLPGAAGQFLDGPPIAVPRLEVHARICPVRIPSQDALHPAGALHEPPPVVGRQSPEAADPGRDDGEGIGGRRV